jgi:hypothetical protein
MNWVWKKPHNEFARGLIMGKGLAALKALLRKLESDLVRLEGRQHFLNRQLDENIFPSTRRKINAEKVPVSRGIAEKEKQIASVTKQIDAKKMEPGVQEKLPFASGGGVTGASRPTGLGPMHVPRGTVYMQTGGAIGQQQGGGMFLQPDTALPAFNAADYLSPTDPVQPAPTNFSPYGDVYTPTVAASTPLAFTDPTTTTPEDPTTTTPEDTTVNQSYAAAPVTEPLEFVSPGGITTGNYLGGTAAELAPDTYFAPNIPGAGQEFTSQFSDPDAMQHLDYSDYPKRSDFGSSDEGGHIDFKQAEREWWRNKAGMGQSYADGGGVEGESAGILSLSKQPGFNLRDVTDIVFDPSSTLDKVLLPLLFAPPIAATAQLIKMGYKGASLTKAMAHLTNMQQKLPKWALGSPGPKPRGFDPKTGSPVYTKKDLVEGAPGRILGGPTTGRRSYVQGQVIGETAAMPFSGSREIDEFRTQDFAKGGIVSLSIGI